MRFRPPLLSLLPSLLVATVLQAQVVTVTPTPSSFTNIIPNSSYNVTFAVTNPDDGQWFTFDTPKGSSPCTYNPSTAYLTLGVPVNIVATCTSGGPSSSGNFKLRATSADSVYVGQGSASWTTGVRRITISAPGGTGVTSATVRIPRPVVRAQFTPQSGEYFDVSTTKVYFNNDDVTTLARFNQWDLEVEVDSLHQLAPGMGLGVTVYACLTNGKCTSDVRTLTMPNDSTPLVDLTAMPLEHTEGGFSGSFGQGLSLAGADVQAGFATPPYVSVGAPRSTGLVFSTRTSYPRALVAANITLPWPAGSADQLKAVLLEGGVRRDSLVVSSPTCATGAVHACRVVLQAEYATGMISGGVSRRWMVVQVSVTSGGVTKVSTDSTEVVLVDRRDSPYGSGWWPSVGMSLAPSGNDRILVSPDGTASIFRGLNDTLYLPPAGSTMTLVKLASGWELRPRGSHARVVFDASGRLLKAVDGSGNRDSLAYDGQGRVVTLFDPMNKTIAFWYNATTGKLDSLVSLPGTAGKRTTRVVIDTATNQLRYDSLSSPAARPVIARYGYQVFGSVKGTALLRARAGRYGSDSVTVLYDSTTASYRPIQARLLAPAVGGSVPIIGYRAADLQGWKSYQSLDSIFVEVTDPLGRWARSRLDRWGGSVHTWDQLGTLSRTAYDPVGRVLWTEGKLADSSRIYSTYDNLGRLVRTYMLRSGSGMLRLDSLTYDSYHRVNARIDSRGGATTYLYDTADRIYSEHGARGGYTTRTFRTDGQLQAIQQPSKTTWDSVQYDNAFHNPVAWYVDSAQLVRSVVLDSMGRAIQEDGRIRVEQQAVLQWQVRRSNMFLDAVGRSDSTVVSQSSVCNDPCTSPSGFTVLWTSKATLDSINRPIQVQVVGDNAATETFNLDRLGRVIGHGAPGGGRDSMVYDLAGNVTKRITRRGDTLTTSYDARNRPDSSYIPGYGTVRRTYGGPQDQLTRLYVTGYVDSLGGVNPNRAFVYDQRGRLTQDTLWTGGVARGATYAYDNLDRISSLADTLGTWVTEYLSTTGLIQRRIAPTGDTLSFAYDSIGRVKSMTLLRGTSKLPGDTLAYSSSGELLSLTQGDHATSPYGNYTAGKWSQVGAYAGKNLGLVLESEFQREVLNFSVPWIEQLRDSMGYDALRRLKSWKERFIFGNTGTVSETYSYDNNGNLTIGGTTPTFASGSNRLTAITRTGGAKSVYWYDGAGNLIQRDDSLSGVFKCSWQYGYNGNGQMVSVRARGTTGSLQLVARYAYDVGGTRIARRVYTNTANCTSATAGYTRYAVRDGQVQYETDSLGTGILRRYVWGMGTDDLVAVQVGTNADSIFYAITDRIGSIRAWTTKDGKLRWWGRYRPYGAVVDSGGTTVNAPYRWTTREFDPETGLYFHRARQYDPSVGRFIQEDPLGRTGSGNPYGYVEGSPLQATDPSGLAAAVPETYTWCSPQSGRCLSADGQMMGNEYWWAPGGGDGGGAGFVDFDGDGYDDISGFADFAYAVQMINTAYLEVNGQTDPDRPGFQIYYQIMDAIRNANWDAGTDVDDMMHQIEHQAGWTRLFAESDYFGQTIINGILSGAIQFNREFLKDGQGAEDEYGSKSFQNTILHESWHFGRCMSGGGWELDSKAEDFAISHTGYVDPNYWLAFIIKPYGSGCLF